MGIADAAGASRQLLREEDMVDAKPIIACAEPRVFALQRVAVPPQIAKPDLLDRIHVMRCRVDCPRLIHICATSIKVTDGLLGLCKERAAISASQ